MLGVTALLATTAALSGCGGRISSDDAARDLQANTLAKWVTCEPATGEWKRYDYKCVAQFDTVGSMAAGTQTLGVNVDSKGITFQTAP